MEDDIKFKSSNESFFKYLKNKGMLEKGTYYLPKKELETFFDIKTSDNLIKFSVSIFNGLCRFTISEKSFLFYKDIKEIKEIEPNGNEKIISFQSQDEEEDYLKIIKDNPNLYDLSLKISDNEYQKMTNQSINIINLKDKPYKVNVKEQFDIENIGITPFYKDYIFIINPKAYQNFTFINSTLRDKLFRDLNTFLTSKFVNFYPICGHSGSGKTTSILYYLNQNRKNFNLFYINCYTISRSELKNDEIKNILLYELKKAVNSNENIITNFTKFLEDNLGKEKERKSEFIFNMIQTIIDIYIKASISEKLNIIIDQYSSKYDTDNKKLYLLLDEINRKNNKIKIILLSSMNNTCVSRNMRNALISEIWDVKERYIDYVLYGQFFELVEVISKEKDEFVEIMNNVFRNSGLIYYKLKSKYLDIENENNPEFIFQFIEEEKKEIEKEMEIFYDINSSNRTFMEKENLTYKILEALKVIEKKEFYNYAHLHDLFDKLPFKYFEILYHEIDVSHPEFINLLPKHIQKKLYPVAMVKRFQQENMLCKLKDNLKNEFEELNNFLCEFKGTKKQIISFFTVEPIYQLIDVCLKELIVYYMIEEHVLEEIYLKSKGGIKGNIFEYILIDHIKSQKKFINYKFDLVEYVNSIVPYYFLITKFSHRLLINKDSYKNKLLEGEGKNEELDVGEKDNESEIKNTQDEKIKNNYSKINVNKIKYTKSKDKNVFIKLQEIIDKTFYKDKEKDNKILPKKNILLNQLNSNSKYVDGALLIFVDESNQRLNFKLKLFQISIKREKYKIFNRKEISLISTYVKEHLENIFSNINIIEICFYYIIDESEHDNTIKNECEKNLINCYRFKIDKKIFNKVNNYNFFVNKFSKFNSCFILKSNTEVNEDTVNLIDNEEPILFDKLKKEKLEKYYEPLFEKDMNLSDKYYLYNNLKFDLDFHKHLTEYSLLVFILDDEVKYIIINEQNILDYSTGEKKDIDKVNINRDNLKLITFLIPMILNNNYD